MWNSGAIIASAPPIWVASSISAKPGPGMPASTWAAACMNRSIGQKTGGVRRPWYWSIPSAIWRMPSVGRPSALVAAPSRHVAERPPDRQVARLGDAQGGGRPLPHDLRLADARDGGTPSGSRRTRASTDGRARSRARRRDRPARPPDPGSRGATGRTPTSSGTTPGRRSRTGGVAAGSRRSRSPRSPRRGTRGPSSSSPGEPGVRAEHRVAVDPHARVALGIGEPQDLVRVVDALVELAAEPVEAAEVPQDREELRHLAVGLDERQRLRVRVLGLAGVAAQERDRSGAGSSGASAPAPSDPGSSGVVARTPRRSSMSSATRDTSHALVDRPERVAQRVEPREVVRGHAVAPGDAGGCRSPARADRSTGRLRSSRRSAASWAK